MNVYLTEFEMPEIPAGASGRLFAGPPIRAKSWDEAEALAAFLGDVHAHMNAGLVTLRPVGILGGPAE